MDLIAELERATEGSRELDYAIARETGWRFTGEHEFKEHGVFWRDATTDEWKQLPWWTTSLDAALTLIPEGWRAWFSWGCGFGDAGLMRPTDKTAWTRDSEIMSAPTTALALCIAALKARQAMEKPA